MQRIKTSLMARFSKPRPRRGNIILLSAFVLTMPVNDLNSMMQTSSDTSAWTSSLTRIRQVRGPALLTMSTTVATLVKPVIDTSTARSA